MRFCQVSTPAHSSAFSASATVLRQHSALAAIASCEALADDSAARVVKRYAQRVGLDPASYAGHSLRSGFLTSAAESGASIWKLSEVSRHKSLDTLRGYIRNADLFKEHAGAAFL
jgi:site-specific recombinase XerD